VAACHSLARIVGFILLLLSLRRELSELKRWKRGEVDRCWAYARLMVT
jgi:hypothetical protein